MHRKKIVSLADPLANCSYGHVFEFSAHRKFSKILGVGETKMPITGIWEKGNYVCWVSLERPWVREIIHTMQIVMMSFMTSSEVKRSSTSRASENLGY